MTEETAKMPLPTITVANIRTFDPSKGLGVYVGRDSANWASRLPQEHRINLHCGNPYAIGANMNRDQVCDEYLKAMVSKDKDLTPAFATYNWKMINWFCDEATTPGSKIRNAILKHHNRVQLICWCAPLRCHASIIKRAIESVWKVDKMFLNSDLNNQ